MKKLLIIFFACIISWPSFSQTEVKITQMQFDAITTLATGDVAVVGLIRKKFDGTNWLRLEWLSEGANGNWNIDVKKIIILNRSRNAELGVEVIDNLNNALRTELANGTITLANAAALLNRIPAVMLYIELGWLEEARVLLNNMTTDANALTAGRKTYILGQIDAAIAKI